MSTTRTPPHRDTKVDAGVARLAAATVLTIGVAWLAWQLADVLLLLFAAIILATALRALAGPLVRRWNWSPRLALAAAALGSVALLAALGWLIGDRVGAQIESLRIRLPDATAALAGWLDDHALGREIVDQWRALSTESVPWGRVANVATMTLGALGSVALVAFVGVYLAADPGLYRRGVIALGAPRWRPAIGEALDATGQALTKWLAGQAISMLFVGATTAAGLALLGVPVALSLGLIAGVLAFIPFFGPIVSGILAILFAFTQGPQQALNVAILCIAIQQIEGNVLMPLVQRWAVSLPPVLGIVAGVAFGLLFGIVGVILATPLMVVVMVLVRELYVERFLGSPGTA